MTRFSLLALTAAAAGIRQASSRLDLAAESGTPCRPVRDLIREGDVSAAYAVQQEGTARRLREGERIVGRKIGLTSEAVQAQLGVDQPDFGVLFSDMEVAEFDEVPMSRLLQPKAEAEIAFVLERDLEGDLTLESVRASIAFAVAAIEIVDSRIKDWDITFVDTVADNASSGLFVLGSRCVSLDEFEPSEVEMSMTRNGEAVSVGTGAACLGDPLNAVLWLARTAESLGEPLRAGQVVLSGALGPMVPVAHGDVFTASISGLGEVTARFTSEDNS